MTLANEIRTALRKQDIVGLERIIKKVGAERAFSVHLTEDFTDRRLINYIENYPSGLRESRTGIHPEFLTLAIKYDPHLKLEDRLRYLRICDTNPSAFAKRADEDRRTHFRNLRTRIVKLRKLILDHAPDDEKNLMQKLCFIKDKYKSEPES